VKAGKAVVAFRASRIAPLVRDEHVASVKPSVDADISGFHFPYASFFRAHRVVLINPGEALSADELS
jgi:hypothetical protein